MNEIINMALDFRKYVERFLVSTPDDITTQKFYLRKIEGADILLAQETNFLKQECHKWAPVAPEAPPIISTSLSTRKPRPTKLQKQLIQYGVSTPDELPQEARTKQHTFKHHRKSVDSPGRPPQPLQPAPQLTNGSRPSTAATGSGQSLDHKYRVPPPISTAHQDPAYSGMFTNSPQTNSAIELALSPPLPWQTRSPTNPNQTATLNSPLFRPMTPGSSSAPIDPSLFSPSNASFAAAALKEVSNAQAMASPMRDRTYSHSRGNSGGRDMENLFADFTHDNHEEPGRDEVGEALEGLGVVGVSNSSQDDEQANKLAEEFLAA